jgi:hypothetical protein
MRHTRPLQRPRPGTGCRERDRHAGCHRYRVAPSRCTTRECLGALCVETAREDDPERLRRSFGLGHLRGSESVVLRLLEDYGRDGSGDAPDPRWGRQTVKSELLWVPLRGLLAEVQRDSRTGECPQDDEDRGHAEGRGIPRVAKDDLGEDDGDREADDATGDPTDPQHSRRSVSGPTRAMQATDR